MAFSSIRPSRGLPDNVVAFDTESTGLDRVFDQVVQLAALRTDLSFGPATATFVGRACRSQHIVPSPGAMLRTRTSPRDLEHEGWPMHGLMNAVEETFSSWGPALFIGYNSLRFDEPLLRQNLFATLHYPYATQTNGSMRADAMVIAQTVAALDPQGITVPVGATGAPSFALGGICRANGIDLAEHAAHDALADTRATVDLLRVMRDRSPDVLAASLTRADKRFVFELVRRQPVLFRVRTIGGLPTARAVTPIGSQLADRNAIVFVDLAVDPGDYEELDGADLDAWCDAHPYAVTTIRANAFPQLFPPDDPLIDGDRLRALWQNGDGGEEPETPPASMRDFCGRAERVQGNSDLCGRLKLSVARRRRPRPADATVEERMYESFVPDEDLALARDLHRAMPWERAAQVFKFRDDRLMALAARWAYQTDPGTLDPDLREAMEIETRRRLLGPADARWRTVARARAELDALLETATDAEREQLIEIARYLTWIESTAFATA